MIQSKRIIGQDRQPLPACPPAGGRGEIEG
jgi:hypothetical protein